MLFHLLDEDSKAVASTVHVQRRKPLVGITDNDTLLKGQRRSRHEVTSETSTMETEVNISATTDCNVEVVMTEARRSSKQRQIKISTQLSIVDEEM